MIIGYCNEHWKSDGYDGYYIQNFVEDYTNQYLDSTITITIHKQAMPYDTMAFLYSFVMDHS